MAEYTLHCFAQSGNAYKAALMLQLCGADWQPKWVDFFGGATRSAEYRGDLNEMGEVPVLEHGDTTLTQSGVILDYLAEQFGQYGWNDHDERRQIYRWTLFDNHKLTANVATLRFLRQYMKTGDTPVTDFLHGRAKSALFILNKHLDGRSFVVAERPTIADLSLCGYLFWMDEIGFDPEPFSNVNAWLENIKSLPGWVAPYDLMPGHPLPENG